MTVVFMDPSPAQKDGFDAEAQYQMVPCGGVRSMALWVMKDEPEDVIVYCPDPNKAYVFGLYVVQGAGAIRGSGYFVKRDSAIRFFIGGRDPGPTTLTVESVSGKTRWFLLISVKPQLSFTYQLAVLSDPVHVPAKEIVGPNLAANMSAAAKLWLGQANVSLKQVGDIVEVVAPDDLGDTIFIDDPAIVGKILKASGSAPWAKPTLFVFGTWDLKYHDNPNVIGSNSGNLIFVENQFQGQVGALMCAHEIGHALGLPHSSGGRTDLLMLPNVQNNDFLDTWDIESANQLPTPTHVPPWLWAPAAAGAAPSGAPRSASRGVLASHLFAGDARLERCAVSNADHVTPGSSGPHVRKIQGALTTLDGAEIASGELEASRYGPSTAKAVLAYKRQREIVNRAYQSTADDIVGVMTIAALDKELLAGQVVVAPKRDNQCPRGCETSKMGAKQAALRAKIASNAFRARSRFMAS